jgi:hypothetical protein
MGAAHFLVVAAKAAAATAAAGQERHPLQLAASAQPPQGKAAENVGAAVLMQLVVSRNCLPKPSS